MAVTPAVGNLFLSHRRFVRECEEHDGPEGKDGTMKSGAWRTNQAERWVRLLALAVVGYVGGVCGIVFSNGGRWESTMLNPAASLGLMVGALITPWAQLGLLLAAASAVGYLLVARAPRWSCAVFGVVTAATVAAVRLMWRS